MRKFLHRQQLVKKGLACGKSRRTVEDNPWHERLACGWLPRVLVFALFAACLLGAFVAHRGVKLIGPFRHATQDWESWTHKDFPMGLALSGTLVFHLLLTITGAF